MEERRDERTEERKDGRTVGRRGKRDMGREFCFTRIGRIFLSAFSNPSIIKNLPFMAALTAHWFTKRADFPEISRR
jgi:hypothetical protein